MPRTKTTTKEKEPKKSSDKAQDKRVVKGAKKTVKAKAKKEEPVPVDISPVPSAEKLEIINQYQIKEGDTGSPEVQVALLSKRIEKLVLHLKTNPSDNHSRRGLLGIVSKRRRLLNYLQEKSEGRYKEIASKLGLGK